ncbi:MAG: class I SAM-dependent methyltransferase [candidate division WOR-3 bacterium]
MKKILSQLYYGAPEIRALMFLVPPLYWFRREIAEAFIREVSKINPENILEIGFSDAFLTKRLSFAFPNSKIVAIDTSYKGVLRAKRLGLRNVEFKCLDFFDVNDKYDLAISMHVFVLFEHKQALEKIGKVSKTALISLTGKSLFTRLHRPFHRFFTGMDVNIIEPEEYENIAKGMGFKVWIKKINAIERSYIVRLERV